MDRYDGNPTLLTERSQDLDSDGQSNCKDHARLLWELILVDSYDENSVTRKE